jgi:hypothetical protein
LALSLAQAACGDALAPTSYEGPRQIAAEVGVRDLELVLGRRRFVAILLPLAEGAQVTLRPEAWAPVAGWELPLPRIPPGNDFRRFPWRTLAPPSQGRLLLGAIAAVDLPSNFLGEVPPIVPYARPRGEPAARFVGDANVVGGARHHLVAITFDDETVWHYRAGQAPLVLGEGFHLLTRRCADDGGLLLEPWRGGPIPLTPLPERPDPLDVDFEHPTAGCPLDPPIPKAPGLRGAWLGEERFAVAEDAHTLLVQEVHGPERRRVPLAPELGAVRQLHGTRDGAALLVVTGDEGGPYRLHRLRPASAADPWTGPGCTAAARASEPGGAAAGAADAGADGAAAAGCAALAKDEVASGLETLPAFTADGSAAAYVADGAARVLALATGALVDRGAVGAPVALSPDGRELVAAPPALPGLEGRRLVRVDEGGAVSSLPPLPRAPLAVVWGDAGPLAVLRSGPSLALRELASGVERPLWRREDLASLPVVASPAGGHLFVWSGACVRLGGQGGCAVGRHDLFRLDLSGARPGAPSGAEPAGAEALFVGRASVPRLVIPSPSGRRALIVDEVRRYGRSFVEGRVEEVGSPPATPAEPRAPSNL